MYVRVKREKLTVFLHCDGTDTVAQIKSKLQELLQKPAEEQRLFKGGVALEEEKTLAELNVANDDELAVAYKLEGSDEFEPIHIERFDSSSAAQKEDSP
ncbi:hypothetical protein ABPG77_008134 [Micractinium sp. CCAP 211/92]